MESVRKALWFIEGRFGGEVSLDESSQSAGISRYHFAHVFAAATGQSAMRYMRGRRLSEAARVLANGGRPPARHSRSGARREEQANRPSSPSG
jgi:AraC family transcriptional regulator